MGALELTQDITSDYEQILLFQGVVVVTCLLSSVIMFALLLMLIQRAERVLADRMAKNRQLENELHSNEKLVSMGRVIASIAHEIRNPLGIIRSSAELLQRRMGKADAGTSRILQAIYDESVRLSQTVNDFLDYARPRQPRQDLVDLDLVLSQVLAFLEGELGRVGVAIERATSPGLWVRGDKDLLYRAIYNILVNGQQAMDGPGIIRISSRRSDDGRVVLEALDSGPGFDPALLDSVLDPFFTTKDGGTGLGLPIVSSIINSHGGEIRLANGPEGGALVRILLHLALVPVVVGVKSLRAPLLPRKPSPPPRKAGKPPPGPPTTGKTGRRSPAKRARRARTPGRLPPAGSLGRNDVAGWPQRLPSAGLLAENQFFAGNTVLGLIGAASRLYREKHHE